MNKDTEKKVPTYAKSVAVSAKRTGDLKLKLLRMQTSGSSNGQNGGIKLSNSKLSWILNCPPTASPSSVKLQGSKSNSINIP